MGPKVRNAVVLSKNKVKIPLTKERWQHIINSHLEIDAKDFSGIINTKGSGNYIKGRYG